MTTTPALDAPEPAEAAEPGNASTTTIATTMADALPLFGVSISHAARLMNMSRTSAHRVLYFGEWPAKLTPELKVASGKALVNHLIARGANRWEVETLAHALHGIGPVPMNTRKKRRMAAYAPSLMNPDPIALQPKEEQPMLMAKQTLSPAARKAFTLFSNPFDGEVTTDDQMFSNGEIAYVREACMQAAVGGRFVAVVSESGGGKTTMLGDLESRIERDRKPVITIKPWVLGMEDNDAKGKTLKSADILAAIVTTLTPLAQPRQTLQARSNQARDALMASAEAGWNHLLVIEEAHSMPEATMKHLKRLHEMRLGRKPLLGILLLGQTELALRLDPRRASLREVTQRCEVVQLMPLDSDLKHYLAHRAQAANRQLSEFIDDAGIEEIRNRLTVMRAGAAGKTRTTSLLYPLAVNNMMTAALNVAAELGAPFITRDIVRAV